jgi:hypothetical protein
LVAGSGGLTAINRLLVVLAWTLAVIVAYGLLWFLYAGGDCFTEECRQNRWFWNYFVFGVSCAGYGIGLGIMFQRWRTSGAQK